ncbi:2Fe-2S iron-sulfur cluster binding domain-containing protein [Nocardioides sp. GY 10113]|uniref:xanthine dehydrogenase small subunit n=1 Tax=Nocardioides sp. GY 10113 TaxID=2569761 RepID=UPI0010A8E97F|nr:FAD binding domain-containing protein [Nocardioides sp. GY 10113]TIC89129.1 2Fe-2S iron-sulfur cluster binding domain-containing protein [Nocardioides sp. GY 10113]
MEVSALVNGEPRTAPARAHENALDWLRERGLTGAKEGCAEGECGACAVLVARPGIDAPTEWVAVNACLLPAAALAGQEVRTAEGLALGADGRPGLHPVQREMAERGGSQCGYCTPGFICSMAAEYYRPGREGFDHHALSGNLCRCTGYRPIVEAAEALGPAPEDDPLLRRTREEPPAAPAAPTGWFVRPAALPAALRLLAEDPDAVPVAGWTDAGVEANLKGTRHERVVAIDRLPELRTLTWTDGPDRSGAVEIGAALTLTEVERGLDGRVPLLAQTLPQFASRLIRNTATIGGNLGTGSPIGDLAPALLALDAEVVLASLEGERTVRLDRYFTGYRTSVRRPAELIRAVRVPLPLAGATAFHKIAKRRFDDISSVAVAIALDLVDDGSGAGPGGRVVRGARIGLGGVAATPIRALATEAALVDQPWTEETVERAATVLAGEGTPMDDHRASAAYRTAMLGQALRRFHAELEPAGQAEGSPA